ncbi:hypothetical protein TBK1r_68800 [Stieleria magnilauensis]|uniref:Uncharacterized protein n=1 Tax=Stieleria magnilauensis TaxID=2527963 RepID=A0ABX5Y0Q2_9BACT|nr:hypothetical protein TBK1r_68800 [Planctomycetes bacterium TBK1r]
MAKHPNKEIRAALSLAEVAGWTVKKSGPRAHAWVQFDVGMGTSHVGWRYIQLQGIRRTTQNKLNGR